MDREIREPILSPFLFSASPDQFKPALMKYYPRPIIAREGRPLGAGVRAGIVRQGVGNRDYLGSVAVKGLL